jgi:hypothetical protein
VEFDENNELAEGDPEFKKIYESIVQSGKIDDPILIYYYGGKILVLNGLTRLSVVGQRRQIQPGFMKRVPYRLFVGEEMKARGEMIRLNLDGRQRVIKQREFITMVQLFKDQNMTPGEIRKMITGSKIGNYEINNTITVAYYGCSDLIKKLLEKKIALNTAAEIASVEDPQEQQKIVDTYNKKQSLKKIKIRTRGISAVSSMIKEIQVKIENVREATKELGIYDRCEGDFSDMETSLNKLKETVDALEENTPEDAESFVENQRVNINATEEQKDNDDISNIDRPLKRAYKKSAGPKIKGEVFCDFDITENGSGNINSSLVTMEEIELFIKLWWKEFASAIVEAGELQRLAEKNSIFSKAKGDKPRFRTIWLARQVLSPLSGTKHAIEGYYWLRGKNGIKNLWKLEKI